MNLTGSLRGRLRRAQRVAAKLAEPRLVPFAVAAGEDVEAALAAAEASRTLLPGDHPLVFREVAPRHVAADPTSC